MVGPENGEEPTFVNSTRLCFDEKSDLNVYEAAQIGAVKVDCENFKTSIKMAHYVCESCGCCHSDPDFKVVSTSVLSNQLHVENNKEVSPKNCSINSSCPDVIFHKAIVCDMISSIKLFSESVNANEVKLVGEKPMLNFSIQGKNFQGLYDTGSMVSLISFDWLKTEFPEAQIYPVDEFCSENNVAVSLRAANNTEFVLEGVVMLNFSLPSLNYVVTTPFMITKEKVTHPIIGFNLIQALNHKFDPQEIPIILETGSPMSNQSIDPTVSSPQNIFEEFNTTLAESVIIPQDTLVHVKCIIHKPKENHNYTWIFQPDPNITADLEFPVIVTQSNTKHIRVPVRNIGTKSVALKGKMLVGYVSVVESIVGVAEEIGCDRGNSVADRKGGARDVYGVDGGYVGVCGEDQEHGGVCCVNRDDVDMCGVNGDQVGVCGVNGGYDNLSETGSCKTECVEGVSDKGRTRATMLPPVDLDHLPQKQRKEVENLLIKYADVFSRDRDDIGSIEKLQMDIKLTDESPIHKAHRRIPKPLYPEVKEYLKNLEINGWIKKSDSAFSSPIVCVRKKDGSLRICVDYRGINAKTIPDRMPIPRVDEVLDQLGGMKWFSTLDLTQAYHQGYVEENSRKYTAFSVPWALYEWIRIPYGLMNAPTKFQRSMNEMLEELRDMSCSPYMDDIITYGKSFHDHLLRLEKIFIKLRKHGAKLNPKKCVLFKQKVEYLGKVITAEGYHDNPLNTEAVDKLRKAPSTVGELRSLLGFLGYYRSSIKDFARIAKPLYDLIVKPNESGDSSTLNRKTVSKKSHGQRSSSEPVEWKQVHSLIVDKLLDFLKVPPILAYPDFEKEFVVHCDASETGLGAVLYQEEEAKLKVIAFGSRTLSPAEKNYHLHSGKLEFLALKWSVCDKFREYLYYAKRFTVFSDNNPLSYVMSSAKLNATGMRWMTDLSQFNFEIRYRPGKASKDCDFLSRNADFSDYRGEIDMQSVSATLRMDLQSQKYISVNALDLFVNQTCTTTVNSINFDTLRRDQMDDAVTGPVYSSVKEGIKPKAELIKTMSKKVKQLFRYFQDLGWMTMVSL